MTGRMLTFGYYFVFLLMGLTCLLTQRLSWITLWTSQTNLLSSGDYFLLKVRRTSVYYMEVVKYYVDEHIILVRI